MLTLVQRQVLQTLKIKTFLKKKTFFFFMFFFATYWFENDVFSVDVDVNYGP